MKHPYPPPLGTPFTRYAIDRDYKIKSISFSGEKTCRDLYWHRKGARSWSNIVYEYPYASLEAAKAALPGHYRRHLASCKQTLIGDRIRLENAERYLKGTLQRIETLKAALRQCKKG